MSRFWRAGALALVTIAGMSCADRAPKPRWPEPPPPTLAEPIGQEEPAAPPSTEPPPAEGPTPAPASPPPTDPEQGAVRIE